VGRGNIPTWIDTGVELDIAIDPSNPSHVEIEFRVEFEAAHEAMTDILEITPQSAEADNYVAINSYTVGIEYRPEIEV
jgi:hypothetical protein